MSVVVVIGGASALLGAAGVSVGSIAVGAVAEKLLSSLETKTSTINNTVIYPSIFRKINIVKSALNNLSNNARLNAKNHVLSEIDDVQIECVFNPNRNAIDIFFIGANEEKAQELVSQIETEYGNVIQELVYKKLKNDAGSKGLTLESEELTENKSIVLTYNINQ